jgi:hypothetical protein
MDDLIIQSTPETPTVKFVPSKNIFEIVGFSLPENVISFYKPVVDWLEAYFKSPNQETTFTFKINYFNTASSKMLTRIFLKLEEQNDQGKNVSVKWYYNEEDEEMMEAGEEFKEIINLPIEIIPE